MKIAGALPLPQKGVGNPTSERIKMAKKKDYSEKKVGISVQTARETRHPFGQIDRYVPLSKPEFAIFDAIREAVPVVDAAIGKLVRLIGTFETECADTYAKKYLDTFLRTVPTGSCSNGIDSFTASYLDSLIMYGIAIGEMGIGSQSGRIAALYNAPLDGIEIKKGANGFDAEISINEGGTSVPVKHPERLLISTAHANTRHPEGRSLLDGLPFVTSVLMKIYNCIGTNFDRAGNVRYAVTYKPAGGADSAFGTDRASEIAGEWSEAMSDKDGVRDFVAVGDVDIKVIGADSQILDTEVPVRQMLEQIVAKTGLPPFILGFNWSSTERMSSQQADILTSELEYYRGVITPVIIRICERWLADNGFDGRVGIKWNDISLQDEVELARARLLRAQAQKLEREETDK